jgi:hypothetical protein
MLEAFRTESFVGIDAPAVGDLTLLTQADVVEKLVAEGVPPR